MQIPLLVDATGSPKRVSLTLSAVLPGARMTAFVSGLVTAAFALVVGLVLSGSDVDPPGPVLALAALAYLAERQDVRLSATTRLSVTFLPLVFAAVAFGPLAAIVVGVLGLLAEFRRPYLRWAVWTASRALVAGAAGLA